MNAALPDEGRRALEGGVLCHLAVRSRHGPHLTPVVYALDGGRVWVTTSRTSVKARAWHRGSDVAGLVRSGGRVVSFHGRARTYDALDPHTWPAIAVTAPRLARAATRFSVKNARFFAGYAVDARRVPLAWTPPGRLFAALDPVAGWVSDAAGGPLECWGEWLIGAAEAVEYRTSFRSVGRSSALDRRVPSEVRAAVGSSGSGALAFEGAAGLVTLPVLWWRVPGEGSYHAIVPARLLEWAGPAPQTPIALTVDRASTWRAADMAGMLLQGMPAMFSPAYTRSGRATLVREIDEHVRALDGGLFASRDTALIRLRPSRVVWWQGWASGTAIAR